MRSLRKEARLSQDFSVVGSSFQIMGAATEKARLPSFSFILGIESCCEVDDLSCLGMLWQINTNRSHQTKQKHCS